MLPPLVGGLYTVKGRLGCHAFSCSWCLFIQATRGCKSCGKACVRIQISIVTIWIRTYGYKVEVEVVKLLKSRLFPFPWHLSHSASLAINIAENRIHSRFQHEEYTLELSVFVLKQTKVSLDSLVPSMSMGHGCLGLSARKGETLGCWHLRFPVPLVWVLAKSARCNLFCCLSPPLLLCCLHFPFLVEQGLMDT